MLTFHVRLFGKCSVQINDQSLERFATQKAKELFCYLLLHRDRSHSREILASLFWNDCSTVQSKKRLRQELWQLQTTFDAQTKPYKNSLLVIEPDWIRLNQEADLWLDVTEFEQAFALLQKRESVGDLNDQSILALQNAVRLYRGNLLEDCYHDWCVFERERLQNMCLVMLDKLACYCEAHLKYEAGMIYSQYILRYDRAHERTYQRLMRLYYLSGDRTAALRQFDLCVSALKEELNVKPGNDTVKLYEQIRANMFDRFTTAEGQAISGGAVVAMPDTLGRLKRLQTILARTVCHLQQGMEAIEQALNEWS